MKLYTIDGALLTETPEIRLGDKIYKVDNRMSTVRKLSEQVKADPDNEVDLTIAAILGEKAHAEIIGMDLPIMAMREIMVACMAAVSDMPMEEAKARFLEARK